MNVAASIDKLGFRRWYERRLIEAHAYFVTCFLCMITVAVSLEGLQVLRAPTMQSMSMLVVVLAGAAIAFHSFQRFLSLLGVAERYAEHSTCKQCEAYGAFRVIASGELSAEESNRRPQVWMRVRCKKCSHEWRLP